MDKQLKIFLIIISNIIFIISVTSSLRAGQTEQKNTDAYFINVLSSSGIKTTGSLAHSASWGDVDNDGCLDLFATNTNLIKRPRTYLFNNNCDGKFDNIIKNSGITDFYLIISTVFMDINNDNFLDIVLGDSDVYTSPFVYLNTGNYSFIDISESANVKVPGYQGNVLGVDYNRDGAIDIFQSSSFSYLYKNNNDLTFDFISLEAGIFDKKNTRSSIWFDINNDLYPELFLANIGKNTIYLNNTDGTFTDISESSGLTGDENWDSAATCVGDYNNDGYLDIYVVNIGSNRNALYKNNGDGTFEDITDSTGTHDVGDGRTCSFVDYNSDGFIDLFTTNHIHTNKMYMNSGDGNFRDVATQIGIYQPVDIFSATWGDFDGDLVMDVFLNGHLGIALYKGFNTNNSIIIKLVGDGINTNTSAIGSRVEVKTESKSQIREILGGKGCCENDMLAAHFGLGKENEFDLKVIWTSGKECIYNNLNAEDNGYYQIWETSCELVGY